ncbi:MAG: alcohol dehydrogenase catalytic domain-containing protein, partial [Candidatus Eremiobacteraeota bacterium]|nr:alcohol dehydrogenase catalytic domain-containing protein [Candidatus Eremiobacteraeota bacterium]
ERPVPQLGEGEILVRTMASGICSGDIMPWYIRRKAPLVLGHEPAGIVAQTRDGRFAVGDRVFVHHHAPCFECRACKRGDYVQCATWRSSSIEPGAMAEYFRVSHINQRDTLALPAAIAFADAALTEPLACVVKSLRRSGLRGGDRCYVIGLGVMGLMHALVARHLSASVFAGDLLETRRAFAQRIGVTSFHPDERKKVLPDGADVVICGPGTEAAMQHAFESVASGGTVVMFTPFAPGARLMPAPERFYFGDLRLVASYSCGPDDTRAALDLIAENVVDAAKVGAEFFALDELPYAYRALAESRIIKPIVVFPEK